MDEEREREIEELRLDHPLNEDNMENAKALFLQSPKLKHIIFFTIYEPETFVPNWDNDELEARDPLELYDGEKGYKASDLYWDGKLPAAF